MGAEAGCRRTTVDLDDTEEHNSLQGSYLVQAF